MHLININVQETLDPLFTKINEITCFRDDANVSVDACHLPPVYKRLPVAGHRSGHREGHVGVRALPVHPDGPGDIPGAG